MKIEEEKDTNERKKNHGFNGNYFVFSYVFGAFLFEDPNIFIGKGKYVVNG